MKLTDCAELINIKKDIMKKLLLLAFLLRVSFPIYAAEFGETAILGIALGAGLSIGPVSYTHLTLPTILLV